MGVIWTDPEAHWKGRPEYWRLYRASVRALELVGVISINAELEADEKVMGWLYDRLEEQIGDMYVIIALMRPENGPGEGKIDPTGPEVT